MGQLQVTVAEQDIESLLTEPDRVKEYVRHLIEKYVSNPRNGFDGTLHPGLNIADLAARSDVEKYKFTGEVLKTGDEADL